ncbi:hypothetical protein [Pyxidicoccus sp. MSG2]|uniref:hypothetical protein n=1 Tax=Pyxidicoccus sp. MSG2 TaxID=2996790 RepID=UPI00227184CF|nr:hypothetical protein [Pyxidicoccus sp. MSG2]MCY1015883.1 hypothetical protein [Pyxidicoccus sp. MSG2]
MGKHEKLEDQLSSFTGQEGGHARDVRVDAMVWPVFKSMTARGTKKPCKRGFRD